MRMLQTELVPLTMISLSSDVLTLMKNVCFEELLETFIFYLFIFNVACCGWIINMQSGYPIVSINLSITKIHSQVECFLIDRLRKNGQKERANAIYFNKRNFPTFLRIISFFNNSVILTTLYKFAS
jgi:hypothetical protein